MGVKAGLGNEKKTILVAEDLGSINRLICARLEKEGYQVIPAYDGSEALKAINEQPVDLALLNMMMPYIDGSQVLKRIRAAGISIPVIIFSVKSHESFLKQCLYYGANGYLVKPFQLDDMITLANDLLRES